MTESELYQKIVKPFFLKKGYFFFRFEHERIPDLYIAKNKKVLWVELKCINKKSDIIKPAWRPGQLAWIRSHEELGGSLIILGLWYLDYFYFLKPKESYTIKELCKEKDYGFKSFV